MKIAGHDKLLLAFAPEHWTAAGKFKHFLGRPFTTNAEGVRKAQSAIQTVIDHTHKYNVLAGLANRLLPTLAEDVRELHENGHTPAERSQEMAALFETLVCELYSVLDGVRDSLYWLYDGQFGLQKKSTEKLFTRAKDQAYYAELPVGIRDALAKAYDDWFPELRELRTAFTHGSLGTCRLNVQTNIVFYMGSNGGRRIDDIVAKTTGFASAVHTLHQKIFDELYSHLIPVETIHFCGFYKGRGYSRYVSAEPGLNWGSGRCQAREWFENEAGYRCSIADQCPAYARALTFKAPSVESKPQES
ncbi:hypothetical protein [Burkholderia contaminans]|uniref:hypothetical protein n=1 Tax=Burkholderia contaminans TaxID=488447 RepID=UPI0008F46EB0|nr:hypothetical protein [Burkholderia contaminans]